MSADPDVTILDHGSIVILQPNTPEAVDWLEENIGEDNGYQPYWPKVIVEPRYVDAVIDGMQSDGLTVD